MVTHMQLNFAKYKRSGKFGYKMVPPGKVQVPGFCNSDLYQDVIVKGAKGLGITAPSENLSLIVSNGLIRNTPLPSGKPWTLGGYIEEFGGVQARGKRTFGIFMAFEDQEVESLEEFEKQLELEVERKQAERKHEPISKKRKLEADNSQCSVEGPSYSYISLDQNQNNEPLEIVFDDTLSTSYGTYCHLSGNKVIPSVTVKGRQGIWRLLLGKYNCKEEDIVNEMNEDLIEQPERQNFFLTELHSEGITYLKAELDTKTDTFYDKITFYLKETRLVHSKTSVELIENATTPLLVISPGHGNVKYKWEQKTHFMGDWQTIEVPPWTCLLYVTSANQYRCTVETSSILFDVKAVRANATRRNTLVGLSVPYEEVEFNELIGRGSYGAVHKGSFKDKVVALKKIPVPCGTNLKEMIAGNREIAALRMLKHPNIVLFIGYASSETELVLIMEFIDGTNLHHLIFGPQRIITRASTNQRMHIVKGIANGIQFMHTQDPVIVHQDIKPLNVMVTQDLNGIKICDMGLSKFRDAKQTTATTVTPHPTGTYPYMAPEMFGANRRGTGVDIYSLGCLIIEVFGQKRVWGDLSGINIMHKVCGSYNNPPQSPSVIHLPLHCQNICKSCCHVDSTKHPRIQDVVKMLETLQV